MILHRQPVKSLVVVILAIGVAVTVGCDSKHVAASLGSSSKPYQEFMEDPVTLTTIKTVAVFPFDDRAPQPGFDSNEFANKLANQLAAHGKVRVLYPRDILSTVERENREARRHNSEVKEKVALGLITPEEALEFESRGSVGKRNYYDPVKNPEEAVRLARRAKADAVIVGEVSDFDPYMRPRLSLTMRLIATGSTETAANAIAEMTQWGIPRSGFGSGGSGGGTIYVRQQSFDSSVGSVGMDVSKYGLTHHTDSTPYGNEVYIRSMTHYYEVVANQLADAFAVARKKSVKEAEDRVKKQAKEAKQDEGKALARLTAMMERDSRIPDHESGIHGEGYWDQAFVNKNEVVRRNGDDRRIMSWRPEGKASRMPTSGERYARDGRIPENEGRRSLEGYSAMADAEFPDVDAMMERNMGGRDKSWRPDYYFHANPQKAAPLYSADEFRGSGDEY